MSSRKCTVIVGSGLLLLVASIVYLSCRDGSGDHERDSSGFRLHTVRVENGQCAIVRCPRGYYLVIPLKENLMEGRVRVYASKSGNFEQDQQLVKDYQGYMLSLDMRLEWCQINISGGGPGHVYIGPDFLQESCALAVSNTSDPNSVDATQIEFIDAPGFGEQFKDKASTGELL